MIINFFFCGHCEKERLTRKRILWLVTHVKRRLSLSFAECREPSRLLSSSFSASVRQPVSEELAGVITLENLIPQHIGCDLELLGDARGSFRFPLKHLQGEMDLSLPSLVTRPEAASCRPVGTWLLSGVFVDC